MAELELDDATAELVVTPAEPISEDELAAIRLILPGAKPPPTGAFLPPDVAATDPAPTDTTSGSTSTDAPASTP